MGLLKVLTEGHNIVVDNNYNPHMENIHTPEVPVKSDRKIWIAFFAFFFILTCIFWYFIGLWPQSLLRKYPYSSFIAKRTGYSATIDTSIKVLQTVTLEDGGFLVTRSIDQTRAATSGWRTFPSGGIAFAVSKYKDISMVRDSGEIVWRKTYVEYPVNDYNSNELSTVNALLHAVSYSEALDGDANAIRGCGDGRVQIAKVKENWEYTSPGTGSLRGYGDMIGTGVEIDVPTGEIKEITDAAVLCGKDLRQHFRSQSDTIYICGYQANFIQKVGPRSNLPGNKSTVLKEYYQFPCEYYGVGYEHLKADPTKASIPPGYGDVLDIPL